MKFENKKLIKRSIKNKIIIKAVIFIIIFFIVGYIFLNYKELITKKSIQPDVSKPASSPSTVQSNPPNAVSNPSKASSNTKTSSNQPKVVDCNKLVDTYQLPDFNKVKSLIEKQSIVKDFPEKGSMKLKFFHFTEGCRIWDKTYYVSGGKIFEKDEKADIDVWIHTKYLFRLNENNLCELIIEARKNNDLGDWSELSKSTLLWRYKGLIKYKKCLGVDA